MRAKKHSHSQTFSVLEKYDTPKRDDVQLARKRKGVRIREKVKKLVGLCFLSPEARSVLSPDFSLRPTKCVNNVGKRIIFQMSPERAWKWNVVSHISAGVFGQIL